MPAPEERVRFSVGQLLLEGRWLAPATASGPAAVICHPHPSFGGDMDNNVVMAVAGALAAAGFGTLRFNFRGVGASQGSYDNMKGEVLDVKAAVALVRSRPEVSAAKLALVGYSFGGLMALYAAAETPDLAGLALLSPMVPSRGFAQDPRLKPLRDSALPAFACAGTRDAFCPPQALEDLNQVLACRTRVFPDADHFWWGQENEPAGAIAEFLTQGGP